VTPAMGASTVAGEMVRLPIWNEAGTPRAGVPRCAGGLSQSLLVTLVARC